MLDPSKTPRIKPERKPDSFRDSRSVANAKRTGRKLRGTVFLLLGFFSVFTYISIADKAGSDPSGALIFFISAPLAGLGGIFILVGIVMILSGLGSNDSRPLEHNVVAPDPNTEENEKDGEPDFKAADLGARHFFKQTTFLAAAYVVGPLVVLPLLVFLTLKVFGRQLAEFFFR